MSKFNVETAFNEMGKKLATLTAKIAAQTALIEEQNKKIDAQNKCIENYSSAIIMQKEVISKLSTKIDEFMRVQPTSGKNETGDCNGSRQAQSARETAAEQASRLDSMSERARRANKRTQNKDASTLPEPNENKNENINIEAEEWKIVGVSKKKKSDSNLNTIQKGGNSQISTLQAIEKKKFLHVWSLHPDTTEEAIFEHVTKICESKDVKVEKIIPKTLRDYSTFMIGVPESHFEKINKENSWPLNTQFNEWRWFRKSRKTEEHSK